MKVSYGTLTSSGMGERASERDFAEGIVALSSALRQGVAGRALRLEFVKVPSSSALHLNSVSAQKSDRGARRRYISSHQ